MRELPGLNHLLQPAEAGSPAEYGSIPTTLEPTAIEAISDGVNSTLR